MHPPKVNKRVAEVLQLTRGAGSATAAGMRRTRARRAFGREANKYSEHEQRAASHHDEESRLASGGTVSPASPAGVRRLLFSSAFIVLAFLCVCVCFFAARSSCSCGLRRSVPKVIPKKRYVWKNTACGWILLVISSNSPLS